MDNNGKNNAKNNGNSRKIGRVLRPIVRRQDRRRASKQSAPEALGLRTRECHSALTAMRHLRREPKRNSVYPHYSVFRGADHGRSSHRAGRSRRRKSGGSASRRIATHRSRLCLPEIDINYAQARQARLACDFARVDGPCNAPLRTLRFLRLAAPGRACDQIFAASFSYSGLSRANT
jgi:hypothetical protein